MNGRFEGKVAFVTGGASGLGAAAAQRFSDEGAQVAVADIDAAAAEKLAASLRDGYAVQLDTSDARVRRSRRSRRCRALRPARCRLQQRGHHRRAADPARAGCRGLGPGAGGQWRRHFLRR